jgi:ribosomal protein S14
VYDAGPVRRGGASLNLRFSTKRSCHRKRSFLWHMVLVVTGSKKYPESIPLFLRTENYMHAPLLAAVFLLFFPSPAWASFFGFFGDSTETVIAKDGLITVDTSAIQVSDSRFYRYQEGKISVRFFVVRDKSGTVRAAIDACEVCWRAGKGYSREGNFMICKNCMRKFPLDRIGIIVGGCNPHPFAFDLDNNIMTIRAQELLPGADFFPENQQ